ncbi:hypothetical protein ACWOFR_09715 [Carnobacterium gallinarum]|uniref:hypothetical protein n=1 Tax=Carnobacterium gallinarum TaxID=2749 RepID=UPI000558E380|nr:hypothetical protein [Carnobacterium gallinarum]
MFEFGNIILWIGYFCFIPTMSVILLKSLQGKKAHINLLYILIIGLLLVLLGSFIAAMSSLFGNY